ncbi:MAG: helix-turn-helix domain-containing protein [Promethearchaeia archaeon]
MSRENPYSIIGLDKSEEILYKLLIQAAKISRTETSVKYNKIKVTDLNELSDYSKPKVYELVRELKRKKLVQIDNIRPMYVRPIDPEVSIKQVVNEKKNSLDWARKQIIKELGSLPKLKSGFPFSKAPPFSFLTNAQEYYKALKTVLEKAENEILLICGYLVRPEEELLREYLSKKIKEGLKIRILYGGSIKGEKRFRDHFSEYILEPNQSLIEENTAKVYIDAVQFSPALRITIIDNKELIMALKRYEKEDKRINITNVTAIHSDNRDFVRTTHDTFIILRKLVDIRIVDYLEQKQSQKR